MAKFRIFAFKCDKCGHRWLPKALKDGQQPADPKLCARCKSPDWNIKEKEMDKRMEAIKQRSVKK